MQKPCLKTTAFLFILISFLLVLLILYTSCELYTASPPKKNNSEKNSDDNNSSSSSTWTTQLLGASGVSVNANGITSDSNGNVYVTGVTNGSIDGQALIGIFDLFVVKYNANGEKQWTKLLGNTGSYTIANEITSDIGGNIYTTGWTQGNLDGQTKTGVSDLFVVKYNASGDKQWTRLFGITEVQTIASGITSDSNGNVYVTGFICGKKMASAEDLFVVKYNANGEKQWTRLLGVYEGCTQANGITSDSNGNVYVTGYTTGNLDGQTLTGDQDLFVVKYDMNGVKQWIKLLGASESTTSGRSTYANGITSDTNGNIYVTGYTTGNLDGLTLTGYSDLFVVKYDKNGNKLWTRLLGVHGYLTNALSITSDLSGNVYTTGKTNGNLDGQTLTGDQDLFVVKYDTNGNKLWTRFIGVSGKSTKSKGITSDLNGNIYITGWTDGNLDGQTLTGNTDSFIVKYNANGDKQ